MCRCWGWKCASCRVVYLFRISLVIRPVHRAYVVRCTDELLCGRYQWVSQFEVPCICTQWMGECWVEQVSRLHGTMCQRQCSVTPLQRSSAGCIPMSFGRLSTGVGCRHAVTIQASLMARSIRWYEHCGTKQERNTLWLNAPGLGWLFTELLLQHPNQSQEAALWAWCQLLAKWLKVLAICERPVQRYSEVTLFSTANSLTPMKNLSTTFNKTPLSPRWP